MAEELAFIERALLGADRASFLNMNQIWKAMESDVPRLKHSIEEILSR